MSWIVVQTKPLCEDLVVRGLEEQQFETILPKYSREIRHARRIEVRTLPLFPSYLFANIDLYDRRWGRILSTRGVRDVLRMNDKPSVVRDSVIASLAVNQEIVELKKGDAVQFRRGVYAGIGALFQYREGDQVRVTINFMGRDVAVVVHRMDIERPSTN